MRAQIASEPASASRKNEDFAAAVPGGLVVLDGAGSPAGLPSGCSHSVAWYARTLGGLLAGQITDASQTLADALAASIADVSALHSDTCDLANPHSPSAAVAAVRTLGGRLDYLVLSDCTLIADRPGGEPLVLSDNRLDEVHAKLGYPASMPPHGSPDRQAAMLAHVRELGRFRNQPGGFWVASTAPAAAREAFTGSLPLADLAAVALLTDGATRMVDVFGLLTWPETLSLLRERGPDELITETRNIEASDPDCLRWPRSKTSDDATAAHWPLRP
ncbi:MAG TPA: integrase [Actinobacteria bacterium]|nr:integrase [Actinomycetota bacterium]